MAVLPLQLGSRGLALRGLAATGAWLGVFGILAVVMSSFSDGDAARSSWSSSPGAVIQGVRNGEDTRLLGLMLISLAAFMTAIALVATFRGPRAPGLTEERLPLFAGVANDAALGSRRRSHSAAGLAGALRCLGLGVQPSLWAVLPQLLIPTLLITGARDSKFTALAHKMAAELPMGWHVTVPNAGHAVHLEAPQLWTAEVRAFETLQPPWASR